MIYFDLKITEERPLHRTIKELLRLLKLINLELITDDKFDIPIEEGNNYFREFNILSINMVGNVLYLKGNLKVALENIESYIDKYLESEESFYSKIYELSMSRLLIKEFLFTNNLNDPELLEIHSLTPFILHNNKYLEPITINYSQCKFSDQAKQEISQHLYIRNTYLSHLDAFLSLQLEKLNLTDFEKSFLEPKRNSKKEIQLLEIWIALEQAGFLENLPQRKSDLRKNFFELFGLIDWNYRDRHAEFKKRFKPKAIFLDQMVTQLNDYS